VVNDLDAATVVEALTHAYGFFEAGRVTTFRAWRREKDGGGEHEVTVEIYDAGPDHKNRHRVVAFDAFGRRAAGNGHASLDAALVGTSPSRVRETVVPTRPPQWWSSGREVGADRGAP
jgi:hypothetical protein